MKAKRPKQHFNLCEIVWDDASGIRHGWLAKTEQAEPYLALSVGFVIRETPEHIVIAQDTDGEGGHNGRSQIPRGMVKKMRVLRKKDEPKHGA